jgi:hypothetical protein
MKNNADIICSRQERVKVGEWGVTVFEGLPFGIFVREITLHSV